MTISIVLTLRFILKNAFTMVLESQSCLAHFNILGENNQVLPSYQFYTDK